MHEQAEEQRASRSARPSHGAGRGRSYAAEGQGSDPGSGLPEVPRQLAESEPGAEVEPYFPTEEEAIGANKAAYALHHQLFGDSPVWGGVLKPHGLNSALAAAKNHYYYADEQEPDEGERLSQAAAKMAYKISGGQVFQNGNKRTAHALWKHMLDQNGLGHLSPYDWEDAEFVDHLIEQDKYGEDRDMEPAQLQALRAQLEQNYLEMVRDRYYNGQPDYDYTQKYPDGTYITNPQDAADNPPEGTVARRSSILDPKHGELDPRVWDNPGAELPTLKPEHNEFIHHLVYSALERHGYSGPEKWLTLCLTGSLTTYQFSNHSDCDVSLFIDASTLPEWSRAELIGIMVSECDGKTLPGTPHPMQDFVVSPKFKPEDLYRPGLRSGYNMETNKWVVPPEKGRVHDVEREMNAAYTVALENADKMERLLRYEPQKAVLFWHQIHSRRMRDQTHGKGDYSPSNITYKMLDNRGLFQRLSELTGEHIA